MTERKLNETLEYPKDMVKRKNHGGIQNSIESQLHANRRIFQSKTTKWQDCYQLCPESPNGPNRGKAQETRHHYHSRHF